jgi:hypothetical protein
VAVADITPDKPLYLDGYWSDRLTSRVHDPLQVKALVLDDGRTRVAFVVADLIAWFYQWVAETRMKQTAVPPENVILCTTHTHSSPCLLGVFGPAGAVDRDYIALIHERMAAAIESAAASLRPARIGFGRGAMPVENGEIPHFARNWHNPGAIDPDVLLMRVVDAEDGAPIANLVNFANHPDVLGDQTTEISADYLAYVYEAVREAIGGEVLAFQRGLGGVEPIPQGVNDMAAAEEDLRRVAGVANTAILQAAHQIAWVERPRIAIRSTRCEFPVVSAEILKAYAMDLIPLKVEDGFQVNEMALIEIGPAQFLTVPGEPHPEVVFKLTDMMTAEFPFVIAMAMDEIGYVVPGEIYNPAGIQELLSSGKDNELVVLSAARQLLGVHAYREPACFAAKEPV